MHANITQQQNTESNIKKRYQTELEISKANRSVNENYHITT